MEIVIFIVLFELSIVKSAFFKWPQVLLSSFPSIGLLRALQIPNRFLDPKEVRRLADCGLGR